MGVGDLAVHLLTCRVRYKKALGIKNIDGADKAVSLHACHQNSCQPIQWPVESSFLVATVYAMGLYIDAEAAERAVGKEVDCLPAMSPEHSEALAERMPMHGSDVAAHLLRWKRNAEERLVQA